MATLVYEGGIFVGSGVDTYKFSGSILHCARDPWYTEAVAAFRLCWPSGVPTAFCYPEVNKANTVIRLDYNTMALNMVDATSPIYFSDEMVNAGLQFITDRLAAGDPVLVHCNQGISRSPSMALLWMWEHGFLDNEFRYALAQFRDIYPDYSPGNGIFQYLKKRIENYKFPD
jgi:hypothetical protein